VVSVIFIKGLPNPKEKVTLFRRRKFHAHMGWYQELGIYFKHRSIKTTQKCRREPCFSQPSHSANGEFSCGQALIMHIDGKSHFSINVA